MVQAAAADSWIDPVKPSPFLGTGPSHVSPKPGCADWDKGYSQGWCPPESRLPTTVSSPASVPSCLFCCPSLASLPGPISLHSISSVRLYAHRLSLLSYLQAPPMLCCLFLPGTTQPHCADHVHPCLGGWGSLCPRLMGLTIWDSMGPQKTMCVRGSPCSLGMRLLPAQRRWLGREPAH